MTTREERDSNDFLKKIKFVVKHSQDKLYNIQAVANMLGLPERQDYTEQCDLIVAALYHRKDDNIYIQELLSYTKDTDADICSILVGSLYQLFTLDKGSQELSEMDNIEYIKLLDMYNQGNISSKKFSKLHDYLNYKYCSCVKKLYLKNVFNKYINNKESKSNPYALCMSSIYKNRGIKPPYKISYSCKKNYEWYK